MNKIPFLTILSAVIVLGFACNSPKEENTSGPAQALSELDLMTNGIKENPNNDQLLFERATYYMKQYDFQKAINDLELAISIDSSKFQYYHLLADAYIDNFQSKKSIEVLENCLEVFPARIGTLLKLSEFQHFIEDYDNSFLNIQRVLEQEPQNPEAYFMMGLNFKAIGENARAINSFQTAVENDPEIKDAWIMLGQLFHEVQNPIAGRYFDNAIRLDSNDISAIHAKAYYLHQTGQMEGAQKLYQKIILKNKNYVEAYQNLGLLYLEIDSISLALDQFNLAVLNAPSDSHSYYLRGLGNEAAGLIDQARLDYQQAINLDANHRDAAERLRNL